MYIPGDGYKRWTKHVEEQITKLCAVAGAKTSVRKTNAKNMYTIKYINTNI